MRKLLVIVLALFLTACGTGDGEKVSSGNEGNKISASVVVQDDFKLEIKSEKSQYKVGEELKITASLTYTGEDAIEIGHAGSWIFLNTINVTKGYEYEAAMIQPYILTPMKPNEPLIEPYRFSGGSYIEGSVGKPYTDEEFEQMSSMNFPPGKYKIEGITAFNIDGEQTRYNLEAEIYFEVVE